MDYDDAPNHAFPACSARSDGHVVHLSMRDGSHIQADRPITVRTSADGTFDIRATVARHIDDESRARSGVISNGSKSYGDVRPWKTRHEPSFVPRDPQRPFGPANVATKVVRPSIAYAQNPCSSALIPDPGAAQLARSLAPRPVGQPARSPWSEPLPPPDRLSFAVRADRATGRGLRRSKSTTAEKTAGGLPWSIKARTTDKYDLDAVSTDLGRLSGTSVDQAKENLKNGKVNMMGPSLRHART